MVVLSDRHEQAAKAMMNDSAKDVKALNEAEAQRKEAARQRQEAEAEKLKICVDWEIRFRIAQGGSRYFPSPSDD